MLLFSANSSGGVIASTGIDKFVREEKYNWKCSRATSSPSEGYTNIPLWHFKSFLSKTEIVFYCFYMSFTKIKLYVYIFGKYEDSPSAFRCCQYVLILFGVFDMTRSKICIIISWIWSIVFAFMFNGINGFWDWIEPSTPDQSAKLLSYN